MRIKNPTSWVCWPGIYRDSVQRWGEWGSHFVLSSFAVRPSEILNFQRIWTRAKNLKVWLFVLSLWNLKRLLSTKAGSMMQASFGFSFSQKGKSDSLFMKRERDAQDDGATYLDLIRFDSHYHVPPCTHLSYLQPLPCTICLIYLKWGLPTLYRIFSFLAP